MPIRADSTPAPQPPGQPEGLPSAQPWRGEDWRFHLYWVTGGNEHAADVLLAPDVPVADPEVTTVLSGVDTIRGTFGPEVLRLVGYVVPWSTAVVAEYKGAIVAMCIVDDVQVDGPTQTFSAVGFFGYLNGTPHMGDYSRIQVDPLQVARDIWAHAQGYSGGNLGLVVDDTTSPVRIGTDPKDVDFTTSAGQGVSFEAGPYTLGWWKSDNLADDFTTLATSTPFDFREVHTWSGPGSGDIDHRLMLGYPKLGRRRHDLRLHVGENVSVTPQVDTPGDDYASEVLMLGAGEGKKMLRAHGNGSRDFTPNTVIPLPGEQPGQPGMRRRLRRVAVVDDKSLTRGEDVRAAAQDEAAWRTGNPDVATITVIDHPNAPFGSWADGDEVHLTADDLSWTGELDLWLRVLSTTYQPGAGTCQLTVARAERTTRG